jgi:hypothetical protein
MPHLIFDIESAGEAGYTEDPQSIMRKLGYPSAEVVSGHPSLGVMVFSVKKILYPLPEFLSIDEENEKPAFNKAIVTFIKSPLRKANSAFN